jgi:hypothetical protein
MAFFVASAQAASQSDVPVARRPTGESSCRGTFDRAIVQASPDELPVIDIRSL